MRLFTKRYDGGNESDVTGYWLIEIKSLFSIVLLKFEPSHRENYHSHAFNALTFWLKGSVIEEQYKDKYKQYRSGNIKYTPKNNIHKIHCTKTAWCISFRGPWSKTWKEVTPEGNIITLTHGRRIVNE